MLTRQQKEEAVAELSDKFGRATSVIVADYRGLRVDEVYALRKELRKNSAEDEERPEYQVAKNSLLTLASKGNDAEVLSEHFSGPTAVAMTYGDPVSLAKILVDYAKEHQAFEIKGGVLDGKPLSEADVKKLATMPSLDQLRGKLVGLLQAPAGKLARLLNEPGGQLARLVAARRDALEE